MLSTPAAPAFENLTSTGKLAESGAQAMPIGCVRQVATQGSADQAPRPACKAKVCPGTCRHKYLPS